MLSILPAAIRNNLLDSANKRFEVMGESMIEQAAAAAVKTEYVALGVNTETLQTNYILRNGAVMLLISLLSGACTIMVGYLSARATAGMARNLRRDVFTKVESFSNHEFDKFSVSSLITRSTNDITQLQMLIVIMIRMVIYAPILAVGGIINGLVKQGAAEVSAYVSHGVLSDGAIDRIEASALKEVVITDTIGGADHVRSPCKVRYVTVAPLIGEAIRRIANEESVSKLFD